VLKGTDPAGAAAAFASAANDQEAVAGAKAVASWLDELEQVPVR